MLIKRRNVVRRVPGQETSWPAGKCVFPTCRFKEIFTGLPPGQAVFLMFSCGLRSLCLGVPGLSLVILLWCQTSDS